VVRRWRAVGEEHTIEFAPQAKAYHVAKVSVHRHNVGETPAALEDCLQVAQGLVHLVGEAVRNDIRHGIGWPWPETMTFAITAWYCRATFAAPYTLIGQRM
jgi:hypothetical protein